MIGTALGAALAARGDEPWVLTRQRPVGDRQLQWDPAKGIPGVERLAGLDAVVNLSGAPIGARPWTKARRKVLWDSRVEATSTLIRSLRELPAPPAVYLGAGGLGLFGDRGLEAVDDDAPPGTGFLAELSLAWEQAHLASRTALGSRAAVLRMSMVLGATGGLLPLLVPPFRVVGGWLGDGKQLTSWISLRDTVAAFLWLLDHPELDGGFNGTVPDAVPNYEWCAALGRVLHRPVVMQAPKWAMRGALGDLADDLFLASLRAVPRRLLASGFRFTDTEIEPTFRGLVAEFDRR